MFSVFCGLFGVSKKVNPFAIKQIQALFRKCRGVGVASRKQLRDTRGGGTSSHLIRMAQDVRFGVPLATRRYPLLPWTP
jgi:hypothetical protein